MQGKLAKGYSGRNQVARSKIILESFLYREPNTEGSHSNSEQVSSESFAQIDPEEAHSERQEPVNTVAKA